MGRADPRRTAAEKALESGDSKLRRVALKQAMELAYDASDDEYTRLRSFRNILLGTAALVIVLLSLMVGGAALKPDALPLCFSPDRTSTAGTPQDTRRVCPSGESGEGQIRRPSSRLDLPIVAGLGLVGAAVAALVAVRNIRGSSTPYSIPVALAVLKVPAGALTAVAGMLLLGGEFAPGLSNLDSQSQILAYALIFGYAQQAFTGFLDDRAQSILNKLPSKDSEAKAPEPSIPGPDRRDETAKDRGASRIRRALRAWMGRNQ